MKLLQVVLPLFLILFFLDGCAKSNAQKEVLKKDGNVSIRIEGSTYASQTQILISSVPGYIKNVFVKDGDRVNKNDKIFSLDKELMQLDISTLKEDIAALERIRAHKTRRNKGEKNIPAINLAAIELRKVASLKSKGYINAFEENQFKKNYINAIYDNTNNGTQDNYEKKQNTDRDLAQKRAKLKKLEYNLKHADGYAPIDGYVTKLNANIREHIQANQKICKIVNIDNVIVKAGFATGLLPYIKKGQNVKITFMTVPSYKVMAKITKVNPMVNDDFNNMTIEMLVPNHNYILQEGTRVLVNVSLSKEGQASIKEYFRANDKDRIVQISSEI